MKFTYLSIATFALLLGTTNCMNKAEKMEDASQDVIEANKDLDEAKEAYLEEITRYKMETAEKISVNQVSIDEFNARINTKKKAERAEYLQKIADLEAKNSDLKMRMDSYKVDTKEGWDKFKIEFAHDMDELGKAFKDLTVKNVK